MQGVHDPSATPPVICCVGTQALAAAGDWAGAVASARQGAALAAGPHGRAPELEALLDTIAIDAALVGSDAGFDGRHLQVTARYLLATWLSTDLQALSTGGGETFQGVQGFRMLKMNHDDATVVGGGCRVQRPPPACGLQLSKPFQARNLS
jgi:hypothetical protein